jgi:hypothetical protein
VSAVVRDAPSKLPLLAMWPIGVALFVNDRRYISAATASTKAASRKSG